MRAYIKRAYIECFRAMPRVTQGRPLVSPGCGLSLPAIGPAHGNSGVTRRSQVGVAAGLRK